MLDKIIFLYIQNLEKRKKEVQGNNGKGDELGRRIKEILSHREIKRVAMEEGLTRASILLPLLIKDDSYQVLFTRRTDRVKQHKGEISFPGGIYDASDQDLLATALREACEEIGVRPEDVEILGELDEVMTVSSNFIICPFVGFIPYPYPFVPSYEEIEEIIILPLGRFLKQGVLTEEYRSYPGKAEIVYSYRCGGYIIWGATAKILRQFLQLIRVEDFR